MQKVCFFSSDARPLYKRDVFRAISYPADFVIHFRYRPIHISGNLKELQGKEGVIFLLTGNDLAIPENQRQITEVSIREVIIYSIEEADDTGLIHFYLKLGNFTEYKIVPNQNPATKPPNKLVTSLEVTQGNTRLWHDVIKSVAVSFPNQLFYKFQLLNSNHSFVNTRFDEDEKQSFYKLTDETNYLIDISFYDTEPDNSKQYHSLKVTPMNNQFIKVVAPTTIDIEARRDNRIYSLFTQTISSSNSYTYLNFETILKTIAATNIPITETTLVDTTLKIEISKNRTRSFYFACLSILAAFSVAYTKILTDKVDLNGVFNLQIALQFVIPLVTGFFSAYHLYKFFDKK